jgi:hypothetical protein
MKGQEKVASGMLSQPLYEVPGLHGVDCWPSCFFYSAIAFESAQDAVPERCYA